jgi:hypothetical protein
MQPCLGGVGRVRFTAVSVAAVFAALSGCETAGPVASGEYRPEVAEARDMRLIGYNDLQARSAYQPVIQRQGSRYIAYVGHHGGTRLNPQTGPQDDKRMVFMSWFNAGVRAVDIRDPYNPKEIAYYVPAISEKTDRRCLKLPAGERCKRAVQTNNVEVDDRGYIYIVDRADTGMHILELTGSARGVASFGGR